MSLTVRSKASSAARTLMSRVKRGRAPAAVKPLTKYTVEELLNQLLIEIKNDTENCLEDGEPNNKISELVDICNNELERAVDVKNKKLEESKERYQERKKIQIEIEGNKDLYETLCRHPIRKTTDGNFLYTPDFSSCINFEKIKDGKGKIVAFIYNGKKYPLELGALGRKKRKDKKAKNTKNNRLKSDKNKSKKSKRRKGSRKK